MLCEPLFRDRDIIAGHSDRDIIAGQKAVRSLLACTGDIIAPGGNLFCERGFYFDRLDSC